MRPATGWARRVHIVTSLGWRGRREGGRVLLNMHCPAHNTQTQSEQNDKTLVTTTIASNMKDLCLLQKKMFLSLVFALFIWISPQLLSWKQCYPTKLRCIVIIREYSLLFARGRLSKRWPVVLMCDLTCQVSRDGRNLLTVHCAPWPPSPSLPSPHPPDIYTQISHALK